MGVSSYFEFVTTLFGWILYDRIWAVLVDTGIVFIPIIAMVVGNILDSHKGGDDEGSAALQSLKKIEADFIAMLGVLIFAGIPMLDVRLTDMEYAKPALRCTDTAETIQGTDTGTTYDKTLSTLGDEEGRIPLWWALMHWLSKAITAASVAGIPCSYDMAAVEYKLAEANIEDPDLNRELGQFTEDCWRRAYSRYAREDKSRINEAQRASVNWLGSYYFLSSGLYDQYTARQPNNRWTYESFRDAGYEDYSAEGGFPTCSQWWASDTVGLRRRILDTLDPALLNEMVYDANNLVQVTSTVSLSQAEREDVFLRKYLAVKRESSSVAFNGPLSTSYSDGAMQKALAQQREALTADSWLAQTGNSVLGSLRGQYAAAKDAGGTALAGIGGALKAGGSIGEGHTIRNGVALFQPLALMMMIMALPLLLIFSRYKLGALMTLSIIYFGFHFLTFIWAVAYWFDNQMMGLLTSAGGLGVFASTSAFTQTMIMWYVTRFLYIIFPILYLGAVGWVGIHTGSAMGELSGFGGKAGAIGASGGQAAQSAVTKGRS
ncbi:MAG: conjugal transfer protein TraG N-terminal domain-containing protein [Haliea sp.]